jgi:hypothetical protein
MEDDFVPDTEPPQYATLREKLKEGKKIYCVDEATATKIKVDIPDLCCCYDFNNDYDVYIITPRHDNQGCKRLQKRHFYLRDIKIIFSLLIIYETNGYN